MKKRTSILALTLLAPLVAAPLAQASAPTVTTHSVSATTLTQPVLPVSNGPQREPCPECI